MPMWSLKFLLLSSRTLEASAGSANTAATNIDLKYMMGEEWVVVGGREGNYKERDTAGSGCGGADEETSVNALRVASVPRADATREKDPG